MSLTVGSRPTSSATATVWCSTNPRTSTPRRCRSSRRWRLSSVPTTSPSFTATTTIRYASTTILPATTTRSRGTTSTSAAGSTIPCRSKSISSAATASLLLPWPWTSACSATWQRAPDATAYSDSSASS